MRRILAASSFALLLACVGDTPAVGNDAATDAPVVNDSGGGNDASPDTSAPWTPANLDQANSLALWLESSSANLVISNGKVGVWKDLSQNHNDAANPAGGPTVTQGAINGHDGIHFDSVALVVKDHATLQFGISDQFYIAAVAKVETSKFFFFSKVTNGPSSGGTTYVSGLELFTTSTQGDAGQDVVPNAHIDPVNGSIQWSGAPINGAFHLVSLRRTGPTALVLGVDGVTQNQTVTARDLTELSKDVAIGLVSYGNILSVARGDLAELIIVHDPKLKVVADGDVAQLNGYLKKKYGL